MVGGKLTQLIAHGTLVHVHLTDEVCQLTSVDFHRTGRRAQAIRSTGLVAIILILFLQRSQALLGSGGSTAARTDHMRQVANLTLHGDTHTARQRQSARHTVDLAEATLDTLVGTLHLFDGLLGSAERRVHEIMASVRHLVKVEIEHGQRFQTFDEAVRIVVKDNALVQQALRVEDSLQLLHHLIGLVTPLILHEGRHIAACAVFGLQRAVIALYHEFGHSTHHLCIACHLMLIGKALVQDEVVVALKGMTIDAGVVIAMVGNEFLQFDGGLRQTLNGERHILDETAGAHGSCASHAGEDATADGPVLAIHLWVFRELGRDIQFELSQTLLDFRYLLKQLLVGHALRLGQDGRQVVIVAGLNTVYLAGIYIFLILQEDGVVNTAQRLIVQHLSTLHH